RMIDLFIHRARAFEKLRRLSEAAADYDSALRINRRAPDVYLNRGVMLLNHGDPFRAVTDFDKVIELQPGWVSPYFNRGVALFRIGELVRADQDFSVVIQRNTSDAGAYLNRGRVRAAQDRADAGLDFDRALEIEPEWGGGWFARGQYFDANGNREAANRDFLRAYELGYPDPWLIQRVREISG
ncbi:MAG: tetratricopeptide repeat protein, partial [Pseudomonadota bacterium]